LNKGENRRDEDGEKLSKDKGENREG